MEFCELIRGIWQKIYNGKLWAKLLLVSVRQSAQSNNIWSQ